MLKKIILSMFLVSSASYSFITLDPPVIGEKEGLDAEISLGAKYSSGNTDSQSIATAVKTQYSQKEWLLYFIAAYSYGESSGDKNTNDGLFHLRYVHEIANTPYDYEFYIQSEFNEFQDVRQRSLAGANIRRKFDIFDKFYLGVGLFYSYMEPDTLTAIDPIYKRTKIDTYISFLKKVNEHFSITYLGYYQPNIEDFSDFRVFQVVQFTTALSENIALSFDVLHKYNATPYHYIEKTDIKSTINLKYQFK